MSRFDSPEQERIARYVMDKYAPVLRKLAESEAADRKAATPIPAGAMRVAPGTDAVVWRICPDHGGEL